MLLVVFQPTQSACMILPDGERKASDVGTITQARDAPSLGAARQALSILHQGSVQLQAKHEKRDCVPLRASVISSRFLLLVFKLVFRQISVRWCRKAQCGRWGLAYVCGPTAVRYRCQPTLTRNETHACRRHEKTLVETDPSGLNQALEYAAYNTHDALPGSTSE